MLLEHKQYIIDLLQNSVASLLEKQGLALQEINIQLERPKKPEHGDLACNIAMQLSKALKKAPLIIAEEIIAYIPQNNLIRSAELAPPGFINLRLNEQAQYALIPHILEKGIHFGRVQTAAPQNILLEFVSANPTGPLHVGHGRQAALGDALANLLETQGNQVTREFYYNDAGVQINNLAISVQARAHGLQPGEPNWPQESYHGEYIADIARDFKAQKTISTSDNISITASGDVQDLEAIRRFAVAYLRHEQDIDLKTFGVHFDQFYLESSLYTDGKVAATVTDLKASGKTYEQEGALWLKTTDYGDDKDRVMQKSDGHFTYFVPDVAYHVSKWQRGYTQAINIQGSDHHGTMARVKAGLQALNIGIPKTYPDYLLHKMVTVLHHGQEVKISKRSGSYVTLRDLIEWCGNGDLIKGRDAVRFFLLSRKADSEFVFDIDLALSQSESNPVYYIQYAHARICSVLRQAPENSALQEMTAVDFSVLQDAKELALLNKLAAYPELLERAAKELAPHQLSFYLRELAAEFHAYYNSTRVLIDDAKIKTARLLLLKAVRQVLVNALGILGVSAPEQM